MKSFDWNAEKNQTLISERGISFEDVLFALLSERLLDDLAHPNQERYPSQRMLVVEMDEYAWLIPYVEDEQVYFLKTIIPSRKATRRYLRR
jgi:uncharacterized DUF497 family protein